MLDAITDVLRIASAQDLGHDDLYIFGRDETGSKLGIIGTAESHLSYTELLQDAYQLQISTGQASSFGLNGDLHLENDFKVSFDDDGLAAVGFNSDLSKFAFAGSENPGDANGMYTFGISSFGASTETYSHAGTIFHYGVALVPGERVATEELSGIQIGSQSEALAGNFGDTIARSLVDYTDAEFSPDGTLIAGSFYSLPDLGSYRIALIDVESGDDIVELDGLLTTDNPHHHSEVADTELEFSPDSKLLIVTGPEEMRAVNTETGEQETIATGQFGDVEIAFAPDGSFFVVGNDGDLSIYDSATGELTAETSIAGIDGSKITDIRNLEVAQDNTTLVFSSDSDQLSDDDTAGRDIYSLDITDIPVSALNRAPDTFELTGSSFDETVGADHIVGSIVASDPDLFDTVSVSLVDDLGKFRLDGDRLVATGEFVPITSDEVYDLVFNVTDQKGASSLFTETVTRSADDTTNDQDESFDYLSDFDGELVVTTGDDGFADDGHLTLREAVHVAGLRDGADHIRFDESVTDVQLSNLHEAQGLNRPFYLDLDSDLTINGDTSGDGQANVTLHGVGNGNVVTVQENATVTLESLVITGGAPIDQDALPDLNHGADGADGEVVVGVLIDPTEGELSNLARSAQGDPGQDGGIFGDGGDGGHSGAAAAYTYSTGQYVSFGGAGRGGNGGWGGDGGRGGRDDNGAPRGGDGGFGGNGGVGGSPGDGSSHGGDGGDAAGGIWNLGNLTLNRVELYGNATQGGNGGTGLDQNGYAKHTHLGGEGGDAAGAILNEGELRITDSSLSSTNADAASALGNHATGGMGGIATESTVDFDEGQIGISSGGNAAGGILGAYTAETILVSNAPTATVAAGNNPDTGRPHSDAPPESALNALGEGTAFESDLTYLYASDLELTEGESGSFFVNRLGDISEAETLTWTIGGDVDDADFAQLTGELTIAVGERSVEVGLDALDDGVTEGEEGFTLTLSGTGETLGTSQLQGTLTDGNGAGGSDVESLLLTGTGKEYDGVHLGNGAFLTSSRHLVDASDGRGLVQDLEITRGWATESQGETQSFVAGDKAVDLDRTGADEVALVTGGDTGDATQVGMVVYANPDQASGDFESFGYRRGDNAEIQHQVDFTISEDAYASVLLKNRELENDVWVTDGLPDTVLTGFHGAGVYQQIDSNNDGETETHLAGLMIGPYQSGSDQSRVVDPVGDNYQTLASQLLKTGGADDFARNTLISDQGGGQFSGSGLNENMLGGDGDDDLRSGGGDDLIFGNTGADTVRGGKGDDEILGGGDADTLFGGSGQDQISGGEEGDRASGGKGDDLIFGDSGNDTLFGGADQDTLFGGFGDDKLNGGSGDDRLFGGDGDDKLIAKSGDNVLVGGAGNDTMVAGDGIDLFAFGARDEEEPEEDIVRKFDPENDKLWIEGLEIGDGPDQQTAAAFMSENATIDRKDLVISLGENQTVRIKGIVDRNLDQSPEDFAGILDAGNPFEDASIRTASGDWRTSELVDETLVSQDGEQRVIDLGDGIVLPVVEIQEEDVAGSEEPDEIEFLI